MVDVTGIEPVTPCLQSEQGKTLNSFVGVAYTENQRSSRSFKYPEVVPNRGIGKNGGLEGKLRYLRARFELVSSCASASSLRAIFR